MKLEYEAYEVCDYAATFTPGLTNPELDAPENVVGGLGKGVVKRYNIYRNNVTVSLIDALAAIYPAVQRITGIEFFRAMARFHVRETPPISPLLFEYGRDFPAFIEAYEYARDMPWLADTARIERAWLDAYHAADVEPLSAQALASVDHAALAQVRFVPHPATRIVRSPYPAVAIFAMNRLDGPVTPLNSSDAEDALVTRPDHDVIVSRLPQGGAAFLATLLEGEPLGAAVQSAFGESEAFDLAANLSAMISAGVFSAIELGA
ncbi:MAG TPA: DNA-binding domain-containing protein [Trinickia sp.]|nr:DNA-binding domain-containing protein [Trinickia sp.]